MRGKCVGSPAQTTKAAISRPRFGIASRPRSERTILDEAKALVHGARNQEYGPPSTDFARTAGLMTALFRDYLKPGKRFCSADVAKVMICVKLSRLMAQSKRDSWVDLAGYAETGSWTEEG
jgi:hypothetical protein